MDEEKGIVILIEPRSHSDIACSTLCLPDKFARLCRIYNDLSKTNPRKKEKPDGTGDYYEIDLTLVLFFEGIELKAQVAWFEDVSEAACLSY